MFTIKPIFCCIDSSKFLKLGSLLKILDPFFFLKILTKFSDCLTESFLSTILDAIKLALSSPTKIFA